MVLSKTIITWYLALPLLLVLLEHAVFSQDFRISETGQAHFGPSIAADSVGNFVVVWSDARNSIENGGPDTGTAIYAQRFSADGLPIGNNFRVSEASLAGGHWIPSISMNKSGVFVVAWEGWSTNRVDGDIDIYARRYVSDGVPVGSSFKVNDDIGTSAQGNARVLVQPSGSFVVTWLDRRDGPLFSYAQLYDSTGVPIDVNFMVNSNSISGTASLGGFDDGRFFFMWAGYLQTYNLDGSLATDVTKIGLVGKGIAFGVDSILILWTPAPQSPLYGKLYRLDGTAITDSFKVSDDTVSAFRGKVDMARSRTGEFMIVWQDHRNDPPGIIADGDIYAQRYGRLLDPIGNNFKVNHEGEERAQREPATIFFRMNIVTVWLDDQTPERCPPLPPGVVDRGIANIEGAIQPFDNPIPGEVFGWRTKNSKCPPPLYFALYQNFPNPFNLETTIAFDVPQDSFVDIRVYDLLGRQVQQVVHSPFVAGRYHATFSATGLPSGIYFYRLSTGQLSHTQKMILTR